MPDRQQSLFGDEPAPWDADDQSEALVATVVFPGGPPGDFDYLVPDPLCGRLAVGQRVKAPLGKANRLLTGYCTRLETRTLGHRRLKAVRDLVDPRSLLSPAMLRLTRWIADYYLCDWATVLETVLPAGVRVKAGTRLTTFLEVAPSADVRPAEWKLSKKQESLLNVLREAGEPLTAVQLARIGKCTQAPITALRRKGLIRAKTVRIGRHEVVEPPLPRQANIAPNPDQKRALDAILSALNSGEHRTVLVHGVTGSGKTEVYIQAIQEVVRFGRQAIVLVPEISLTPQTVERFRARFDGVAVLHSHQSDAERHWQWQRIAEGGVQVVVGARSAVFAPTPQLGLVVLDEEHESSFKQETAPRYHARDVALQRAKAESIPLVLGSATPSLESWYRAQTGQYVLAELRGRVLDRPLPAVGTIDLRDEAVGATSRGAISRQLHVAMRTALQEGGQVILLLNRRGFSTHIQCPACGFALKCPDCDIALTHHRTEEIALCHYCDYQVPAPAECPECQFRGISYRGLGTQRLEAEVRARFPDVPCLRMDTDSMRGRGAHAKAFEQFRSGKVRILLGTQMIAKGLDFPNVTLVGVINADTALHLPDFRAAERTFHLVTQVAGRTGRGEKGGRVLVQTFNPESAAIRAAVRHDYAAFAAGELPMRKMFGYPPFAQMVRLVVRGPSEPVAAEFAATLAARIRAALGAAVPPARVLGPAPAPFAKLRGRYRFQIQLQGPDGGPLREAVVAATSGLQPPEDVQWIADVDPVEML